MALPRRQIFTLVEIANRWNVGVNDLACYAIDDVLLLSTVVNGVDAEIGEFLTGENGERVRAPHGRRRLSGVQHLFGYDIWPAFKGEAVILRRFRPEDPGGYIDIDVSEGGIRAGLSDLIITRAERDRFEAAHGLTGDPATPASPSLQSRPRSGPGAPPRHDWDGFWITVCRQIHDNGWPTTQASMVRELMDWFATNADQEPDESTVRKKVARLWRTGIGASAGR